MEKKVFEQPIIEVIEINQEDIITTSGITASTKTFDPQKILKSTPAASWYDEN